MISYSAGVFVSSLLIAGLPRVRKRVAVNGNPYLFDEKLGLSARILQVLESVDLSNYLEFRRLYMVETDEEFGEYNRLQSLRSIDSCARELAFLKEQYAARKMISGTILTKPFFPGTNRCLIWKTRKNFTAIKSELCRRRGIICFSNLIRLGK